MWTGINTNRGVVLIMTIAFLGPALGELVGGWVAQYKKDRGRWYGQAKFLSLATHNRPRISLLGSQRKDPDTCTEEQRSLL
jgi:hypothetical protein